MLIIYEFDQNATRRVLNPRWSSAGSTQKKETKRLHEATVMEKGQGGHPNWKTPCRTLPNIMEGWSRILPRTHRGLRNTRRLLSYPERLFPKLKSLKEYRKLILTKSSERTSFKSKDSISRINCQSLPFQNRPALYIRFSSNRKHRDLVA